MVSNILNLITNKLRELEHKLINSSIKLLPYTKPVVLRNMPCKRIFTANSLGVDHTWSLDLAIEKLQLILKSLSVQWQHWSANVMFSVCMNSITND